MPELTILRNVWIFLWARFEAARGDERGASMLETVLIIAGLATIAIATIAVISSKVSTASNNIPTGPSGP